MKGRKTPKVYEMRILLLVCSRDRSTTIHPRAGVRVSPAAREVDVSMLSSLQREAPERAIPKPRVPRRALPSIVHSISDGSPVADQMVAATAGARAFATVGGMASSLLLHE